MVAVFITCMLEFKPTEEMQNTQSKVFMKDEATRRRGEVHHTETSPTALRGQCKQFPIPEERRGMKKDHEDFFSAKFAVWTVRGTQTLVSVRPMKTEEQSHSWLKTLQTPPCCCLKSMKETRGRSSRTQRVRERERERGGRRNE